MLYIRHQQYSPIISCGPSHLSHNKSLHFYYIANIVRPLYQDLAICIIMPLHLHYTSNTVR